MTSDVQTHPPQSLSIPLLRNGDRLTQTEFLRRYHAMPGVHHAELVEGRVYIPSPVSAERHGEPHFDFITWLGVYRAMTPGVVGGDNSTLNLDLDNSPQPDGYLRITEQYDGQTRIVDGHLAGAPELIVEVVASSVSYDLHDRLEHGVGPGSSPIVHGGQLILIQDGMDQQYVTSLDAVTGKTIWTTQRPPLEAPSNDMKKSYCTPVIATDSSGREQLLCMGSQWMISYNPTNGEEYWRRYHGKGFSVVPRPVVLDDVVFFATGFGKPELWAGRIDGVGDVTTTHVVWTVKKGIPSKSSPLLHDGLIYLVDDNGVAACFDVENGDMLWKKRLGGKFSASPLLAGGHLYFGNHEGEIFVLSLGEDSEVIRTNQVDGQIMASPAAIDNALILRTDKALYRFEKGGPAS